MRPLTITLPPEVFAQVVAGEKKIISTKRNPRKDRYFAGLQGEGCGFLGFVFRSFFPACADACSTSHGVTSFGASG